MPYGGGYGAPYGGAPYGGGYGMPYGAPQAPAQQQTAPSQNAQ
jgi:hypothetical protein